MKAKVDLRIVGLIVLVILVGIGIEALLPDNDTYDISNDGVIVSESIDADWDDYFEDDILSKGEEEALIQSGLDPNNVTTDIGNLTDEDGKILTKRMVQYATLADAENAMGYYLGLHNTIESAPSLKLTGMYTVGDNEWHQALYEDDSGTYKNITIKTSMSIGVSELTAPYKVKEYSTEEVVDVDGIDVTFVGNSHSITNLVYFDVLNGKAYTIYTSVGNEYSVMYDIVEELIKNLKIMDDWVGEN